MWRFLAAYSLPGYIMYSDGLVFEIFVVYGSKGQSYHYLYHAVTFMIMIMRSNLYDFHVDIVLGHVLRKISSS